MKTNMYRLMDERKIVRMMDVEATVSQEDAPSEEDGRGRRGIALMYIMDCCVVVSRIAH